MSLHQHDSCLAFFLLFGDLHFSYLDSRTSFHKTWFSFPSLHFWFPNKAILESFKSLTPRHPSSLGMHILSHLTYAIFLTSWFQPQKKIEMQCAKIMYFPFHMTNLLLTFCITHYWNKDLLKFSPIDILEYINGTIIIEQFKIILNLFKVLSKPPILPVVKINFNTWSYFKISKNAFQ